MTCEFQKNGFCEKTKRPVIEAFCDLTCKGEEKVWSQWLDQIQSKIRPENRGKQKADQAKIIAELPPFFVKVEWAHKHAEQILAYRQETGRVLVSPEWKAARLAACDDCEKLWVQKKTGARKCLTCGCNVAEVAGTKYGKAAFEALSCKPWKAVDAKYKQQAGG